MFTLRIANGLQAKNISAQISWFPLRYEFAPFLLSTIPAPLGTDIVLANSWSGFAFKRDNIPLVVTLHHSEFGATTDSHLNFAQYIYRHALIRRYEMRSFHVADKIAAVSQFGARSLDRTPYAGKVEVIYNGIDTVKFHPVPKIPRKTPPLRLLFVGKYSFLKGADMLPSIMSELGSDFQLAIAGKVKNAKKKEFVENMTELGWQNEEEMIRAYQECDALLFPSRTEGLPYTVLEAMACGKPVIASNATSLPELVVDGVTGVICQTGDAATFVAACRQLASDFHFIETMGTAARRRVVERFSSDTTVENYVNVISRLVKKGIK